MANDAMSNQLNISAQYLTFDLAGEMYGVEILKVQEIRGWEKVRNIPNAPDYIKGALNLRGEVVPIIDLRIRFAMENREFTPVTVVIVLCVKSEQGINVIGVVADAVADVLDIKLADIKEKPNLGSKIDTRFMRGIYVYKQNMIMLLDVDKLLNPDEFESLPGLL
ncbi:MAG: chemotaxis protein CheW [Methyloprofundus sp.]|nr:chemotaxis protein CheW [Methyloprofundus sp.]